MLSSLFFFCRSPVNTEEVDDYLDYVTNPMDFEKMHQKLDDGEYQSAQVYLFYFPVWHKVKEKHTKHEIITSKQQNLGALYSKV